MVTKTMPMALYSPNTGKSELPLLEQVVTSRTTSPRHHQFLHACVYNISPFLPYSPIPIHLHRACDVVKIIVCNCQ